MVINSTISSDAPIIHNLMIKAFMEYKNEIPPSALEETVQSVSDAFKKGEKSLIAYEENNPVGMVRFQLKNESLYFYRLSVIPEKQGEGIGKKILKSLEDYANKFGVSTILCKVRMTVPKNMQLYSSIGYVVYDEEVVHKPNGINIKVASMKKEL
ncbi:ribosomal protein S18 acetylase RimI-like enzyme [Virgibacillus natechei]|uniref:Ribosomal protein S18 acetylase RimI-like enzyme n=1 Tax=Virgibacillus natechei TaxID=1216297 RepID=A0ABS4IG61_9BACI|nr:GNAT family N-acetyltransferase [Virgibacillus natechei]MBP1969848.1 ribosomal protein S18 acetylase RimI-like enzyme [Virgibacillus natechei]UZD12620.1 GNAT family N-acetyltransferase [Virgibacillus natechei]